VRARGWVEDDRGHTIGRATYALTQHARHVAEGASSANVHAVAVEVGSASLTSVRLFPAPLWDVPVSDDEKIKARKVRVRW